MHDHHRTGGDSESPAFMHRAEPAVCWFPRNPPPLADALRATVFLFSGPGGGSRGNRHVAVPPGAEPPLPAAGQAELFEENRNEDASLHVEEWPSGLRRRS